MEAGGFELLLNEKFEDDPVEQSSVGAAGLVEGAADRGVTLLGASGGVDSGSIRTFGQWLAR